MRPQDGGKNPNGCEHDNDIADGIVARARRDRTKTRVAVLVGDDGPTLAIVERDVRPIEKAEPRIHRSGEAGRAFTVGHPAEWPRIGIGDIPPSLAVGASFASA